MSRRVARILKGGQGQGQGQPGYNQINDREADENSSQKPIIKEMAAKRLIFLRSVKKCANLEQNQSQMGAGGLSPMSHHWLRAWSHRLGTPRAVDSYFSRSTTIGKGRLLIL